MVDKQLKEFAKQLRYPMQAEPAEAQPLDTSDTRLQAVFIRQMAEGPQDDGATVGIFSGNC
jgi:hypothetical protein